MLSFEIEGRSWESTKLGNCSRDKHRPPHSTDDPRNDDHTAGAVNLGLLNDSVEERDRWEEETERRVHLAADATAMVIP